MIYVRILQGINSHNLKVGFIFVVDLLHATTDTSSLHVFSIRTLVACTWRTNRNGSGDVKWQLFLTWKLCECEFIRIVNAVQLQMCWLEQARQKAPVSLNPNRNCFYLLPCQTANHLSNALFVTEARDWLNHLYSWDKNESGYCRHTVVQSKRSCNNLTTIYQVSKWVDALDSLSAVM